MITRIMLRLLSTLLLLVSLSHSLRLNIHLPLIKVNKTWGFEQCPYNAALEANLALRQNVESEELDFFQQHSPHLTLFMTDFVADNETLQEMIGTVKEVVSNHSLCSISWPQDPTCVKVAGAYAMIPIAKNDCLQSLSDDIVRALQPYVHRPPEIPDWVKSLPLIPRLVKLWFISRYGSPNVFRMFSPHVTVGFDPIASKESRLQVFESLPKLSLNCQAELTTVQISRVGVGGSVLQDGVLGSVLLNHDTYNQTSAEA
jgi:hypothetical protein